jgi:hypothetical protein
MNEMAMMALTRAWAQGLGTRVQTMDQSIAPAPARTEAPAGPAAGGGGPAAGRGQSDVCPRSAAGALETVRAGR